jgi:hypothetical protein
MPTYALAVENCGYDCERCPYTDCVLNDSGEVSAELVRRFTPKVRVELTPEKIEMIIRERKNAPIRAKYAENIEAERAKGRAKYAAHREAIQMREKKRRMTDPEFWVKRAEYIAANIERIRACQRKNYDPEKKKAYYEAHRDEIAKKARERRANDGERINARRKELREANRERARKYRQEYYTKNRDKILAQQRARAAAKKAAANAEN